MCVKVNSELLSSPKFAQFEKIISKCSFGEKIVSELNATLTHF